MKKLNILKIIVDIFWVLALFTTPLMFIMISFVLTNNSADSIPIRIQGVLYDEHNFKTKLLLVSTMISFTIIIYTIFIFRKVLREFQKTKIFSEQVFKGFHKMGISLIIAAILTGISSFLYPLFAKSKMALEFSLSPFILMLCFGLFFMVLSEVFKVAKQAKEENELTV
ncbi:DUF2975 domain-containing protein [Aurantibacter sp.]|uniref:DUF2975 domain-containing protein n=1 Tax=Aurantibacter sp. TaxID=2807103 RepID=UPI0035C82A63